MVIAPLPPDVRKGFAFPEAIALINSSFGWKAEPSSRTEWE
jgi:hypothetical protein